MKKVWYITADELGEAFTEWTNNNPHNNGHAVEWTVMAPDDSGYPEVENFLLSKGLNINDIVIIHSVW